MVIVTIPWWAWLAYLPLLLTWRLTLMTGVLVLRVTVWTSRRIYRATRTQIRRRRDARRASEAATPEYAS